MDSSSPFYDAVFPTTTNAVAKSRRTPSFSSSSSSSSSTTFNDDSPSFPTTPLHHSSGRIPFSWEKIPGIPKKPDSPSLKVLPLPPPITPTAASRRLDFDSPSRIRRASSSSSRFVVASDPFFAALVECSKGDGGFSDDQEFLSGGGGGEKVGRSISDRFGFVGMYASCKRTCAVSESIVYLPRSSPARASYDLLSRRR
ncbi:unnamed protein product [Linum trigynum]|uniref:Uncharacterized protein n=1 Tax=Linum trigynum TaxID=586398 RepID=A0AAV2GH12_9ROSI